MNDDLPVHLTGKIFWLPPHRPEKPLFSAETIYRALGKFTADFSVSYTVLFSYSSATLAQGFHNVRINCAFFDSTLLPNLIRNSEILIMDGYRVLAVCRQLTVVAERNQKMGDQWLENGM